MSRSTALRTSIACLAFLPALTACSGIPGVKVSVSAGTGSSSEVSTAPEASQQASTTDDQASTTETSTASTDSASADTAATQDASQQTTAESEASSAAPAADNGNDTTTQSVAVPAGTGLTRLDVIDIYGGDTSGGAHGRVTAVYKAVTDRPVMLNLRIRLFDKSGKEIAQNDGLNSIYTVGPQYLVTTNLIELPKGATPHSFKASLIEVTPMSSDFSITKMPMPTVGKSAKSAGTQSLKGTITMKGAIKGTVEAEGACVMPNGKIYQGTDTLTDNPVKGNSLEYDIPLYDADGVDLSKAKCYTSA